MKKPYGVLLLNVGTPKKCDYWSVKNYLTQFLMDKRVIDLPFLLRFFLVHFLITPFRALSSAKKYQEIWQKDGSILQIISKKQCVTLQEKLKNNFIVAYAMRYQEPSIASQVQKLIKAQCEKIILVPLFPQYSSAASGSALQEALHHLSKHHHIPEIKTISQFYSQDFFIDTKAKLIKKFLTDDAHLIISFHGLPLKHLTKNYNESPCAHNDPCPQKVDPSCYRAQCFATAQKLVKNLNLASNKYSICFQSRLGRQAWIQPYLETTLNNLRGKGIKNIVVACPSFVSDCLETTHEIGIETKKMWHKIGGEKLTLVPCVNDDEQWLCGLSKKIQSEIA